MRRLVGEDEAAGGHKHAAHSLAEGNLCVGNLVRARLGLVPVGTWALYRLEGFPEVLAQRIAVVAVQKNALPRHQRITAAVVLDIGA